MWVKWLYCSACSVETAYRDPKGSLSFAIPAQTIAQANQELQAAVEKETQVRERRKRGTYNHYSPRDRADIGRYASQHGVDVTIHVKATNTEIPFVILHFSTYVNKFRGILFSWLPQTTKIFQHKNVSHEISKHNNFLNYSIRCPRSCTLANYIPLKPYLQKASTVFNCIPLALLYLHSCSVVVYRHTQMRVEMVKMQCLATLSN